MNQCIEVIYEYILNTQEFDVIEHQQKKDSTKATKIWQKKTEISKI